MISANAGVERTIDALSAIRLAQSLHGTSLQGHPLIHEAIRQLAAKAKPQTIERVVADALAELYGLTLPAPG